MNDAFGLKLDRKSLSRLKRQRQDEKETYLHTRWVCIKKWCVECVEKVNTCPKRVTCTGCKSLQEYRNNPTGNGYCARIIMFLQPDPLVQKGMLQEQIESSSYRVISFTKFHCECNWTEYCWGGAKKYARDKYGYTIDALRKTIPNALNSVESHLMGKYYRKSMRIMEAYRHGLQYWSPEFNQTVYNSHHRVKEGYE